MKYIVGITKSNSPLYLPSEYRALVEALSTPLDARTVRGKLSWQNLDENHPWLSLGLRKKLDHVPPPGRSNRRASFFETDEMASAAKSNRDLTHFIDDIVFSGYRAWNSVHMAPTAEILIDIAHQLSTTSLFSRKEWFVLICDYVPAFGKEECFESFLKDHQTKGYRVPTDTFRTLDAKLYGINGCRNNLPLSHIEERGLRSVTDAWRKDESFVELLTQQLMGDNAGDASHN